MQPKKNNNLNIDQTNYLLNANVANKFKVDKSDAVSNVSIAYTGKGKKRKLELITPDRPFQQFIINEIISKPSEKRLIYWFYSNHGNLGKSAFIKWIAVHYDTIFIEGGGKADIKSRMVSNPKKLAVDNLVVLIDVPREDGNNVSYGIIDHIKVGIMSPNYVFKSPHVIIFAYAPPKLDGLSIDRWRIYEIYEDYTFEYLKINVELYHKLNPEANITYSPYFEKYQDEAKAVEMVNRKKYGNVRGMMGDSIFSGTSEDTSPLE
jgi:hypothetical protein